MTSTVEVLYVSSAPAPDEFARIKARRKPGVQEVTYGMAEAGFKFHLLLQRGLLRNGCRIHSLVGRYGSRRFYRGHFWRRRKSAPEGGLTVDHLGMPLQPGVKQAWLAASFIREARRWERRTRGSGSRIVIVDGAYVTVMPGVLWALRRTDVTAIGIFADLYSYMADVVDAGNRRAGRFHGVLRRAVRRSLRWMDGFVVITEQMNAVINPDGKAHLVMEGMVDVDAPVEDLAEKSPTPTVAYLGALRAEYGLDVLVDGFRAWENPDARLEVFGQGDYAPEISAVADRDERVMLKGPIPLDEVPAEEQRAWLLVNPRPADQEFTIYSFPSKNMEYLASGTPLLTTRLPGMPAEYLEYVLTIDEPGAQGITRGLEKAFAEGREGLAARGARGQSFVVQQKNNVVQTRRILDLAEECSS